MSVLGQVGTAVLCTGLTACTGLDLSLKVDNLPSVCTLLSGTFIASLTQ